MELVTIQLGDRGLAFAERNRVRIPFTLPGPATQVYPLLQSFRFKNREVDKHIRDLQVSLTPLFNSGASTTQGEIEIETIFKDDEGIVFNSADIIELEVAVLVVGV